MGLQTMKERFLAGDIGGTKTDLALFSPQEVLTMSWSRRLPEQRFHCWMTSCVPSWRINLSRSLAPASVLPASAGGPLAGDQLALDRRGIHPARRSAALLSGYSTTFSLSPMGSLI
jgi:glucokinase